ncbi:MULTISPECIES: hypothetical protein [unclassified Rhizobium]|uniref:hypothetical protein n=1 Tax=unclassified Rhizobium TaxID=2613769 RepID=UPI001FE20D4F|nr:MULTISPECIES: hypothetical protein [Rhizobium]UWU23443.1 hypothetical protein N2601_06755 [Rhizobium tropici]
MSIGHRIERSRIKGCRHTRPARCLQPFVTDGPVSQVIYNHLAASEQQMNAAFKPVSDQQCSIRTNIETGRFHRLTRLWLKEDQAMLVLIVAVAVIGSFALEYAVHLFANNYEIEWASPANTTNSAQEIANAMRKTHRESERQMNKAFKVASDGRW